MNRLAEILALAKQRAQASHLPYTGALTPTEAYEMTQLSPDAKLVDVRTQAEWDWVGRIPHAIEIEWLSYPGFTPNSHFLTELTQQANPNVLLMFVCRSGGRSHSAAITATEAGYKACYNVLEGFEGDKDAKGHRSQFSGWKAAGLPWIQG